VNIHPLVCGSSMEKALQEILVFLIENFSKKPPYGFFGPMSNLTKMPFWTNQFGLDHFDWIFLVGLFE